MTTIKLYKNEDNFFLIDVDGTNVSLTNQKDEHYADYDNVKLILRAAGKSFKVVDEN